MIKNVTKPKMIIKAKRYTFLTPSIFLSLFILGGFIYGLSVPSNRLSFCTSNCPHLTVGDFFGGVI